MSRVAVIYYSATGTIHAVVQAVRVRLVEESLPADVVARNPWWRAFVESARDLPKASLDDLGWADAVAFGTPTRFGNVTPSSSAPAATPTESRSPRGPKATRRAVGEAESLKPTGVGLRV